MQSVSYSPPCPSLINRTLFALIFVIRHCLGGRHKITDNVLQLHEVWDKVRLNFRLKTELSNTKPALELD